MINLPEGEKIILGKWSKGYGLIVVKSEHPEFEEGCSMDADDFYTASNDGYHILSI